MASTAKYQRAPSEEPIDDYSHAPPAYAEASTSRDETAGLFGAPRSSEDNIPDDFKVSSSSDVQSLVPSPVESHPLQKYIRLPRQALAS